METLEAARQHAEDAAGGLQRASQQTGSASLRRVFAEHSLALGTAASCMATALMVLGERPDEGATTRAKLERLMMRVRAHLPDGDGRLARQCLRIERAAASALADALSLPWPADVRPTLLRAATSVRGSLAEIETVAAA